MSDLRVLGQSVRREQASAVGDERAVRRPT